MDKYEIRNIGYWQLILAFIISVVVICIDMKLEVFTYAYVANIIHYAYGFFLVFISCFMKE